MSNNRRKAQNGHASEYRPLVGGSLWKATLVTVTQREKREAQLLRELAKYADTPATWAIIAEILANKSETIIDLNSLLDYREA